MQDYPVSDYGLLLVEEDIRVLGLDEDALVPYSSVDGEFIPFTDGRDTITLCEDSFYMLSLQNAPSLFSQAYASYEEAKQEILERLGAQEELPFDIDDRIGELSGTTFG